VRLVRGQIAPPTGKRAEAPSLFGIRPRAVNPSAAEFVGDEWQFRGASAQLAGKIIQTGCGHGPVGESLAQLLIRGLNVAELRRTVVITGKTTGDGRTVGQ